MKNSSNLKSNANEKDINTNGNNNTANTKSIRDEAKWKAYVIRNVLGMIGILCLVLLPFAITNKAYWLFIIPIATTIAFFIIWRITGNFKKSSDNINIENRNEIENSGNNKENI